MKKEEVVEHLVQLVDQDQSVKAKLVLDKNALKEICYHSGTWNENDFYCVSTTYWNSAEVEVVSCVENIIELLENKDIVEFDHDDFDEMSLGEANDADDSISEIEWLGQEPTDDEKEENDYSDMELCWDSNINDSALQFDGGSVLSMEFTVNDVTYNIEQE